MNTIQTTTEDASMGAMKAIINDVMTIDSSPEPVLPPVIKLPLTRRTFTLD
jgi:hypothetical protein